MNGDITTSKNPEPKTVPEKLDDPEISPEVVEESKSEPFKVGQAYDPEAPKKPKFEPTLAEPEPGVSFKIPETKKQKKSSKKKKLLIILIILILLGGGGFAAGGSALGQWSAKSRDKSKPC